jgi:hypothetical protein
MKNAKKIIYNLHVKTKNNKPQTVGSQDLKFYNRPKCEHLEGLEFGVSSR